MPKKPPTLWSVTLAGKQEARSRRPVVHGDSVYVSQGYRKGDFYESRLLRVHLESGAVLWERQVAHVAGSPVVGENGVIYWSRWDGSVLAFSADGTLIWETPITRRNMRDPALLDADTLLACEWAGRSEHVQLVDRATGHAHWRVNLEKTLGCRPNDFVVCQGHVALAVTYGSFETRQEALIGLKLTDGVLAWRQPLPGLAVSPFVWKGAVHVTCEGRIEVRDPVTGKMLDSIESRTAPPLVQGDGLVMYFDDGENHFVASYKDGGPEHWAVQAWRQSVPESVVATPTLVGDALAVVTEKGSVLTLDAATGVLRGSFVHQRAKSGTGGIAFQGGKLCIAHGRLVTCYALS
jgi:outer membrane protein assembly factor BamB